jgi:hypothetical protein
MKTAFLLGGKKDKPVNSFNKEVCMLCKPAPKKVLLNKQIINTHATQR